MPEVFSCDFSTRIPRYILRLHFKCSEDVLKVALVVIDMIKLANVFQTISSRKNVKFISSFQLSIGKKWRYVLCGTLVSSASFMSYCKCQSINTNVGATFERSELQLWMEWCKEQYEEKICQNSVARFGRAAVAVSSKENLVQSISSRAKVPLIFSAIAVADFEQVYVFVFVCISLVVIYLL